MRVDGEIHFGPARLSAVRFFFSPVIVVCKGNNRARYSVKSGFIANFAL